MTVSHVLDGLPEATEHLGYDLKQVTDLERWLAEPEDPQPQLQTVPVQKVVLALQSGRPARAFLDMERERHLEVMRALTAARRTASPHDSLLIDYQLFHIEADLRWIDHAAGRLSALADQTEIAP